MGADCRRVPAGRPAEHRLRPVALNRSSNSTSPGSHACDEWRKYKASPLQVCIASGNRTPLPPLLWKPILVACAETSLEISELMAGAPPLNCCQYSGQVESALWRRRWWLTCIAASLQPGHVECDFFHFVSANIMNLMPWAASATGIAICPISTALEERRESAVGYQLPN